jgi:hypothetical protein
VGEQFGRFGYDAGDSGANASALEIAMRGVFRAARAAAKAG